MVVVAEVCHAAAALVPRPEVWALPPPMVLHDNDPEGGGLLWGYCKGPCPHADIAVVWRCVAADAGIGQRPGELPCDAVVGSSGLWRWRGAR